MDITKRCISWDKESIFDCGKDDIPLNYTLGLAYSKSGNFSKNFKESNMIIEKIK